MTCQLLCDACRAEAGQQQLLRMPALQRAAAYTASMSAHAATKLARQHTIANNIPGVGGLVSGMGGEPTNKAVSLVYRQSLPFTSLRLHMLPCMLDSGQ